MGNIERKKIDPRGAFVIKGDSTRPPRWKHQIDGPDGYMLVERREAEEEIDSLRQQLEGAVEALNALGDIERRREQIAGLERELASTYQHLQWAVDALTAAVANEHGWRAQARETLRAMGVEPPLAGRR